MCVICLRFVLGVAFTRWNCLQFKRWVHVFFCWWWWWCWCCVFSLFGVVGKWCSLANGFMFRFPRFWTHNLQYTMSAAIEIDVHVQWHYLSDPNIDYVLTEGKLYAFALLGANISQGGLEDDVHFPCVCYCYNGISSIGCKSDIWDWWNWDCFKDSWVSWLDMWNIQLWFVETSQSHTCFTICWHLNLWKGYDIDLKQEGLYFGIWRWLFLGWWKMIPTGKLI